MEAGTESSKTKAGRCVRMVGTSKGPAEVRGRARGGTAHFLNLVGSVRFRHRESHGGGMARGRPELLGAWCRFRSWESRSTRPRWRRSAHGSARHGAASVVGGAGDGGAQGAGVGAGGQGAHAIKEPDPEKMFINVLGGRKGDVKLEMARGELRELGIATEMTKGPLIFKTKGKSTRGY